MSQYKINSFAAAKTMGKLLHWKVTNLQMQKLLYFTNMFYLGNNDSKPLIDTPFCAWDYGPVLPELYHELRIFGNREIVDVFLNEIAVTDETIIDYFKFTSNFFRNFSASKLVSLTHVSGGAWDNSYDINNRGKIISNELISQEYNKCWKGIKNAN